jgi:hypothetical protein
MGNVVVATGGSRTALELPAEIQVGRLKGVALSSRVYPELSVGIVHFSIAAGRAAEREMSVPSFDLATVPNTLVRPLVVAIVHIPILLVALCAVPIWTLAVLRPISHGDFALKLLRELRTWSRDAIGAVDGRHAP